MLERLSASVDAARHKTAKAVGDRSNVFGGRKQVSFHIVISELRAELMNIKQHAAGQPCVLLWIRGETVHVTEDSVGQTVLSWSDTYFAQVVPLHVSGSGFRAKECKFKVQQKGKTIAKTAVLDLTKYCSEIGLARDQTVSVPLQPGGTLYFVISTAPAAEQQANDPLSSSSSLRNLIRVSNNTSIGGGGGGGFSGIAPPSITGVSDGGSFSPSAENSRSCIDVGGQSVAATAAAAKYGAAAAVSAVASLGLPVVTPQGGFGKGRSVAGAGMETATSTPDDGDRPSTSGRLHQRKPSGGAAAGWVAGLATVAAAAASSAGTKVSPSTPRGPGTDGSDEKGQGFGVFKRKARGNNTGGKAATAFAAASGAAAATAAAVTSSVNGAAGSKPLHLHSHLTLRKSDSDNIISQAASIIDLRSSWDVQAERAHSLMAAGTAAAATASGHQARGSGSGFIAAGQRAIRSFTGTPPTSRGAGPMSSPLQLQLPQSTLDGMRNLARRSGATSTCSDTAASAVKASTGAACSTAIAATESGGAGSGGGGWATWLRSGLGWGRNSNHSTTGASAGVPSHPSLPSGSAGGGGGGGSGDQESSALEVAILGATEATELREISLDLLHERDEWRARALTAQDALGRAQTAKGSAVRESQRLEVRLRQYQDELGRRTDGSLLQELVEAKVRIAELANENMKLRRQITHMGPLFYDDSGDD